MGLNIAFCHTAAKTNNFRKKSVISLAQKFQLEGQKNEKKILACKALTIIQILMRLNMLCYNFFFVSKGLKNFEFFPILGFFGLKKRYTEKAEDLKNAQI